MNASEAAKYRNREIGMVHQSFNLIADLDAVCNVMLPLLIRGEGISFARHRSLEMLQWLGLSNRAAHRPAQLSGGEQQRVAIGRALVAAPRVLLADEPTGNLDSTSTSEFLNLLGELHGSGSLTVVLVTHDPAVAAVGTRRIELERLAGRRGEPVRT
jgi:putative ABC transport system ATP-binding protein